MGVRTVPSLSRPEPHHAVVDDLPSGVADGAARGKPVARRVDDHLRRSHHRLDGLVARRGQGTSGLGMQLDSFADFLNFGVAPAYLVLSFLTSRPTCRTRTASPRPCCGIACGGYMLCRGVPARPLQHPQRTTRSRRRSSSACRPRSRWASCDLDPAPAQVRSEHRSGTAATSAAPSCSASRCTPARRVEVPADRGRPSSAT